MCNETKSVTEFYSSKTYKDGYEGRCKQCNSIKAKRYRPSAASRKRKQEYDKQYRLEKKLNNKEQRMREPRDEDLIFTRLDTKVTADVLDDTTDKMKIYLMALKSIAYEVDDAELVEKIASIHEAMSDEVDDIKVIVQSLDFRVDELLPCGDRGCFENV